MKIKSSLIFLIFLFIASLFINSCSVGALVNVKASDIEYPISHTDNFIAQNESLINRTQYNVQKEFSFSFTKWGVSSVIDIEREEDISKELNNIIKKNNGDAIVDLTISVSNPPINGFTFFTKVMSLWGALIFTPLTIIEPSRDYAIIAASSIVLYIFTPAAADIKIEGKVVKLLE